MSTMFLIAGMTMESRSKMSYYEVYNVNVNFCDGHPSIDPILVVFLCVMCVCVCQTVVCCLFLWVSFVAFLVTFTCC